MTNKRILVMNGQRLVQSEIEGGKWRMDKVTAAPAGMKPGIYNISSARDAVKEQPTSGLIIHTDAQSVYQMSGKNAYTKHDAAAFDAAPAIGSMVSVSYSGGRASLKNVQAESVRKSPRR